MKSKRKAPAYEPGGVVEEWLDSLPAETTLRWEELGHSKDQLVAAAPKRFTIYEPMALLSTGTFEGSPWSAVLEEASRDERDHLWRAMLAAISKAHLNNGELTHLAVNGRIPLHHPTSGTAADPEKSAEDDQAENVLRSPLQLTPLYGSFGPERLENNNAPSTKDFEDAFWVSTKQNGIIQTWAPRWTMFSRGNITEKARLLNFHNSSSSSSSTATNHRRQRSDLKGKWSVDLYAGIGYFVFSYAKLGMRVLGWELNPWSVEGLRRGAKRNGWSVRIVQGDDLRRPVAEVMGDEMIVIFLEDNRFAAERLAELRRAMEVHVLHVNGGLLPTSRDTWETSWLMTRESSEAWLHLHENVGEDDIVSRRDAIEGLFREWISVDASSGTVAVEHIEKVKRFSPRVWHCVFDVYITKVRTLQQT
jgi:tRNA wybutosine-synthesizing protein 2